MPAGIATLADVFVPCLDAEPMPAHSAHLISNCGVLARASELFNDTSRHAPKTLGEPFISFPKTTVVSFLRCLYAPAGELHCDATKPDVIKLAHVLDAAILPSVKKRLLETIGSVSIHTTNEMIDLAAICNWDDVRIACVRHLVEMLEVPFPIPDTSKVMLAPEDENGSTLACRAVDMCAPLQLGISDIDSGIVASQLVKTCSAGVIVDIIQALSGSARRTAMCGASRSNPVYISLLEGHQRSEARPSTVVGDVIQRRDAETQPCLELVASCDEKYGAFVKYLVRRPLEDFMNEDDMHDLEYTAVFPFHARDFVDGASLSRVVSYENIRFYVEARLAGDHITAYISFDSATNVKTSYSMSNLLDLSCNTVRVSGPNYGDVDMYDDAMDFDLKGPEPRFFIMVTIHSIDSFADV